MIFLKTEDVISKNLFDWFDKSANTYHPQSGFEDNPITMWILFIPELWKP